MVDAVEVESNSENNTLIELEKRKNQILSEIEKERIEWVRLTRLKFCRKEMILEDGSLNKEYFMPKGLLSKQWTEKENSLLITAITSGLIGEWNQIQDKYLSQWEELDICYHCSLLLGAQNLNNYIGWKGTEDDIKKEYEKNKEIGIQNGKWVASMLVE